MEVLRGFIGQHFFSGRAQQLLDYLTSHHLDEMTEMVIEQIREHPQPALGVIATRLYTAYKKPLQQIKDRKVHDDTEEMLLEFAVRLMGEYYQHSNHRPKAFVKELKSALRKAAENVNIDPNTMDGALQWELIEASLSPLQKKHPVNSRTPEQVSNEATCRLRWNQEADWEYFVKVLVEEYEVFQNKEAVEQLFSAAPIAVACNANRVGFLVYLFRQLCPEAEDPDILDGRIIHADPKRQLWPALAQRLIKADGKRWSLKTLKNICSKTTKKQEYETLRQEVATMVDHLRSGR